MAGWAQTIIVGNVGRDVTFKYTLSGVAVARALAEVANQYVKKGQQTMVVGTVEAHAFTGKDGTAQASLELTADNFQMLGGRDGGGGMGNGERSSGDFGAPPSDMSDIPF